MEKRINDIAGYLLIAVSFFVPLLFSPYPSLSFQFAKIIPIVLAVFICFFILVVKVFNDGKVSFSKHPLFIGIVAVPLAYLISGIFSVNRGESLLGLGFETGTAGFIFLSFLLMLVTSYFLRTKEKIFIAYATVGASFLILGIFHVLRLIFGADFLSFGIFQALISNTVGRWSDVAIFSGAAALLSLMTIEFLRLGKLLNILAYFILAISVVLLSVTNFPLIIWGQSAGASISVFTLLGLFALVFSVYLISASYDQARRRKSDTEEAGVIGNLKKVPPASLAVLVISVIFTIGSSTIQPKITQIFKVEPVSEVRLLWQPTASLSWSTLSNLPWYRPIVGNGPEQFSYKWMLDKPADINNTVVWNTSFTNGVGFIMSSIVTVGLLGFLSWMFFLAVFCLLGFKAIFGKFKDSFSQYLTCSSFLVSLFLWLTMIFYTPSIFSIFMTFFFSGLFIASLLREGILTEDEFVFENSKQKSFISIMSLIVILMLMLFFGYKIGEKVAASVYANNSNYTLQTAQSLEDVDKAQIQLENAASLNPSSVYFRALANLSLAKVNTILEDQTTPVEELRTKFQNTYGQTLNYARLAVAANPNSYDNYIVLGNVLARVVSLGVPDAYENAKIAYEQAGKLNPNSPVVPFLLARLEADKNNPDAAKQKIVDALNLKPYYLDAIVLLGRIQLGQGETQDALASFSVAQSLDPENQDLAAIIRQLQGGQIQQAEERAEDIASTTEEQ